MCGIAGLLLATGSAEAAQQQGRLMADSIRHRGPDDCGVVAAATRNGGAIVFAHRRLAIIDLSPGGHQPMASDDGSVQLILNGEIYNFEGLRRELARKYSFRSKSDTETIVHGYEEWGEGVIGKLDGMFALAIWDARNQKLLLARDRFGKKPLFWARDDRGFYFASEIKAILAAGFRSEMAPDVLPEYLALGYVPTPRTMFRGIHCLPPATYALVDSSLACEPEPYWDWPLPGRDSEASAFQGSEDEARQGLERCLSSAVEKRLMSDVPLGVLLSGGVDSTAVALYARRLIGPSLRTFTVGFQADAAYDERPFADTVARTLGTQHTASVLEAAATPALIDTLLHHHDEPFGDSSALPTYLVSQEARRHVTVVLNGDGGDEVFAGYPRFGAALYADGLPQRLRAVAASAVHGVTGGGRLSPRLDRFFRKAALPSAESLFEWCSWFDRPGIARLLPGGRGIGSVSSSYVDAFERAKGAGTLNRLLYTNARTYLLDDLLPKVDRMTMAHGLEARSPFLDTDLATFAASLPDHYKWKGRSGKRLLKSLLAPSLPPGFLDRPKQGFGVPLDRWFRTDLREFVGDLLSPGARVRHHLEGQEIDRLRDDHLSARADNGPRLWTLATLELWLRKYAC